MKWGQIDHSHSRKNYTQKFQFKNRTNLFRAHLLKDQLDVFARVVDKDAMIICKN